MSVALGVTTLFSGSTHQLPDEGEWINEPNRVSVYGVRGTLQITDERHGRPISIACTMTGYSTLANLKTARDTLDAYVPAKSDLTLTVVAGVSTLTYYHCTFDGVERLPSPNGIKGGFYDGSGVNGWMEEIVLHFWQSDGVL